MNPEGPENESPESHSPHEIDQTPPSPQVEEHEDSDRDAPSGKRSSAPPLFTTVTKVTAAAALGVAIAMSQVDKKNGPKTPRPPFVVTKGNNKVTGSPGEGGASGDGGTPDAGTDLPDSGFPDASSDAGLENSAGGAGGTQGQTQEDLCGRESFAVDARPEEIGTGSGNPCEFVTDPDGTMHVIGHTLIDIDGKPRDCFVQPTFSPNAAMKIRGEVTGSMSQQGKIQLKSGKLCVMMLSEYALPNNDTQALVMGEASLHIETNQKVIVKILEPETDPSTRQIMHYALVTPVQGQVLINQDSRNEQLHLAAGDTPLKIPLDIEHTDSIGCYIASTHKADVQRQDGGAYLIGAGAIFMVLRRQQRKKGRTRV